jgi:hypothetical protein
MSERDRRAPVAPSLGPASRAFLQLSGGEAALESEGPSRARKLVASGLAVLALLAVPALWFALGPGDDRVVAVAAAKGGNSGPGSGGDGDDNSGPGGGGDSGHGGDDSGHDDSVSVTASASSTGNRETAGTTTGEATTRDGTKTTRKADTRGTTRGEASTRATNTGTTHGVDTTNGETTRGGTTR